MLEAAHEVPQVVRDLARVLTHDARNLGDAHWVPQQHIN
jgi:hypothetical protein